MKFYWRYLDPLFFSRRFYRLLGALIGLFIIAYASPFLFVIARITTAGFFLFVLLDYISLFRGKEMVSAERSLSERMSNGDENPVVITVHNLYDFAVRVRLIDEVPVQFQARDFVLSASLPPSGSHTFRYVLRPVERGEYKFHDINVFATTRLRLIIRRFKIPRETTVKVFPSFLSLKKFDLVAYSNNLPEAGSRKIRKIGQSVEFEQIREYVTGDDIRTLNWKATARKAGQLMVNNYTDERSQQVYCILDKGRVMKMPFDGMTLLDYAINAALMLSRVALLRQDRAGLATFSETMGQFVPADRKAGHLNTILETLYMQKTNFGESDYEKLYALVRTKIRQRSLLVLFTNFESMTGLERQLPFIRAMARIHLVLVVFFENTGLTELTSAPVTDIEALYIRTIAEKFVDEKRLMVKELRQHGIYTILTPPENLTINTINKYLELKARHAI